MTKTKRISGMVLGILFIGLCVSFLRLSQFGVDPFSAMNLGISGFIGWSFGTWQLLVNAIILVVVFFQARSCIGLGTIINMVFVGYIADFICYVANDVVQIQMNLPLRILALLLAQLMASMGVALYMVADMGIAPYDSVAIIIEKLTHQKIPFHKARILLKAFVKGVRGYFLYYLRRFSLCFCLNNAFQSVLSSQTATMVKKHFDFIICFALLNHKNSIRFVFLRMVIWGG